MANPLCCRDYATAVTRSIAAAGSPFEPSPPINPFYFRDSFLFLRVRRVAFRALSGGRCHEFIRQPPRPVVRREPRCGGGLQTANANGVGGPSPIRLSRQPQSATSTGHHRCHRWAATKVRQGEKGCSQSAVSATVGFSARPSRVCRPRRTATSPWRAASAWPKPRSRV